MDVPLPELRRRRDAARSSSRSAAWVEFHVTSLDVDPQLLGVSSSASRRTRFPAADNVAYVKPLSHRQLPGPLRRALRPLARPHEHDRAGRDAARLRDLDRAGSRRSTPASPSTCRRTPSTTTRSHSGERLTWKQLECLRERPLRAARRPRGATAARLRTSSGRSCSAIVGYAVGHWLGVKIGATSTRADRAPTRTTSRSCSGCCFAILGWIAGLGFFSYPLGADHRAARRRCASASEEGAWRYFRLCTDHKVVGIQYLVAVLFFFFVAGLQRDVHPRRADERQRDPRSRPATT